MSLLIFGGVNSNSKSLSGISLFAVRHINLPPSIALPPPIAIIESWFPSLYFLQPTDISSSLGLGDISENRSDFIFALNYDYTSGKYSAPAEQVAIGGKYELENNLFIKFTGAKNLDSNKIIGYQYGVLYENDCLGIDFNYYRDLTKDRDIKESDGFSFTVVLKPFGSTNNYGKNKVFGPRI